MIKVEIPRFFTVHENIFPFSVLMIFFLLFRERGEHQQHTSRAMTEAKNDSGIVMGRAGCWENGKINRLSGWKHTKTFQVYVYIEAAVNAIMCLLLFFLPPLFAVLFEFTLEVEMNKFSPLCLRVSPEKRQG